MAKILVVDDDPLFLEILCAGLADSGHVCESAKNGKEALNVLSNQTVDLVLSDYEMPIMNGLDLIRHMKNQDVLKNTPVILFTGNPKLNISKVAEKAGAACTLIKPFHHDELQSAISRAVERSTYENLKDDDNH